MIRVSEVFKQFFTPKSLVSGIVRFNIMTTNETFSLRINIIFVQLRRTNIEKGKQVLLNRGHTPFLRLMDITIRHMKVGVREFWKHPHLYMYGGKLLLN